MIYGYHENEMFKFILLHFVIWSSAEDYHNWFKDISMFFVTDKSTDSKATPGEKLKAAMLKVVSTSGSGVTPQMALLQTMATMHERVRTWKIKTDWVEMRYLLFSCYLLFYIKNFKMVLVVSSLDAQH